MSVAEGLPRNRPAAGPAIGLTVGGPVAAELAVAGGQQAESGCIGAIFGVPSIGRGTRAVGDSCVIISDTGDVTARLSLDVSGDTHSRAGPTARSTSRP